MTFYLVFQGLAPSLWGPISDIQGRRVAYCITFVVFIGACIGLSEATNYPLLVMFRCLQSTGSASTIAIGSGVVGDITTRAERGIYMAIFQAGLLAPVAIGPVIGGALASIGWRSIFWFLTIYGGITLILLCLLLPETLRSIVANGSLTPRNRFTRYPLSLYQKRTKMRWTSLSDVTRKKHNIEILGPLQILSSRHAAPIIIFLSIHYAVWQMSITAMSTLFNERYGLSETKVGLTFIANGAGSIIGTLVAGKILDIDYRRSKATYETQANSRDVELGHDEPIDQNFPLERARLRLIPMLSFLQCASIILFGWVVHYDVHIAVPIMSTFVQGWSIVSAQSIVMTYLVDIFPDRSAAASASLNLARCLFAAAGTSSVMPMIHGVGIGLTFTICAIVQCMSFLGFAIQWKFGGRWRKAAEAKRKAKQDTAAQ